jgi:hypothetical protein
VLSEMCVGRMTAGLAVSVFGKNNVVWFVQVRSL